MFNISRATKLLAVTGVLLAQQVLAADLTIASRTEPASMDPHYLWGTVTTQMQYHYEAFMTLNGPDGKLLPSVGTKWATVNDNEWVFTLDPKAVFSNGAPITAADIIASYERAMNLPNSSYKGLVTPIQKYEAAGDKTLKIFTKKPYPVLPFVLSQIPIIPKSIAEKASSKDFLTPEANISGGPYIFTRYVPGDRLELVANTKYYGPKPKWDKVTFRFISEPAARVAALLSGAVDVVDGVTPDDAAEIAKRKDFVVETRQSERAVYMTYDMARDVTPQAKSLDGKPLPSNPFKDVRVRKALALAVNRDAIVQRVLLGQGFVMNQIGSPDVGGYNPSIPKVPFDPVQAKKLLAEAGYPNGFALTATCWSGRNVNDTRICQALGQMLERVGLKMTVDVQPYQVIVGKNICHCADKPSFFMSTWSNAYIGEVSGSVTNVLRSYDKANNKASWNLGEYSNPELDKVIDKAENTIDDKVRFALMAEAAKVGAEDYFILPLHLQGVSLAARKGLKPTPFSNELTLADYITPTAR